ncbi:flagellar hook-length control protein FliK [Sphingomonas hengshuiensis]|uniref:Flagellar hook-length control protein-like C-terminal domain-containing protein n=1 Tax=Sphingomonas hengshuiensis TaxID=1609977 RepID=A0A7U4J8K4_9SPHN|nr:flagellar hook-length control protein FliK [Sphingomonas hengshuiensis]AJP72214.1 hypothetical protein TS85_11065 [Sphingomonas hengshuiensis]
MNITPFGFPIATPALAVPSFAGGVQGFGALLDATLAQPAGTAPVALPVQPTALAPIEATALAAAPQLGRGLRAPLLGMAPTDASEATTPPALAPTIPAAIEGQMRVAGNVPPPAAASIAAAPLLAEAGPAPEAAPAAKTSTPPSSAVPPPATPIRAPEAPVARAQPEAAPAGDPPPGTAATPAADTPAPRAPIREPAARSRPQPKTSQPAAAPAAAMDTAMDTPEDAATGTAPAAAVQPIAIDTPAPAPLPADAGAPPPAAPDFSAVAVAAATQQPIQPAPAPATAAPAPRKSATAPGTTAAPADAPAMARTATAPGAPADTALKPTPALSPDAGTEHGDTRPDATLPESGDLPAPLPPANQSAPSFATRLAAATPPPALPAEVEIAARPGHLGQTMGVEIARRVEAGDDTLRVRMNPAELGRVDVTLAFDSAGSLKATVSADSARALDLLRQDLPDLARTLDQAGVRTDAQSFRFESRTGSDGQQGQPHPQRGDDARRHQAANDEFEPTPAYRAIRGDGQVDVLA